MNDGTIAELAASLKSNGVIQPLVVRKTPEGYQLIAGERRTNDCVVAAAKTTIGRDPGISGKLVPAALVDELAQPFGFLGLATIVAKADADVRQCLQFRF